MHRQHHSTDHQSEPAACQKKGAVYTLEDSFNQDGQDGNPCEPRVADTANPSADASRKLHIRLQTLNLLFDRWIMWEKTPRRPLEVLGLCRNAISPLAGMMRLERDTDPVETGAQ
jgi:hypothetical protein